MHIMDGGNKQALSKQEMMAEAIAFQREVGRNTDRRGGRTSTNMGPSGRGSGGLSSPVPGVRGAGDRTAAGTPRGVSRQPVAQKLATPDQLFGRPSPVASSAPRNPSTPATQQSAPAPVDNSDPMQVDSRPDMPQVEKPSAGSTTRGLVGSRWATSVSPNTGSHVNPVRGSDRMDIDDESRVSKQASALSKSSPGAPGATISNPVAEPSAHATMAKDAGNGGADMNQGKSFHSSTLHAALDTPEAANPSRGLLSSRWASRAPRSSPSPLTPKYPDPSTLEPVYRSDDWLSDLSEEYKALSVKTKNAAETRTTQTSPANKSDEQNAAQAVKTPPSGATAHPQHSGRVNMPATSQKDTTVQPAGRPVAPATVTQHQKLDRPPVSSPNGPIRGSTGLPRQPVQEQNINASPSAEPSRAAASTQAANDQSPAPTTNTAPGGIFNDSAFKDWYNSQFMRRNA